MEEATQSKVRIVRKHFTYRKTRNDDGTMFLVNETLNTKKRLEDESAITIKRALGLNRNFRMGDHGIASIIASEPEEMVEVTVTIGISRRVKETKETEEQ